jgi:mannose-6-phosphate isomerase-like protein (cupin superfamily)
VIRAVRRVIVRAEADGTAAVVADEASPHVHTLPGMPDDLGLVDLWYTGAGSGSPDAADRDLAVAPAPGGSLFRVVQFPPDTELPTADDGAPAIFWHATETTDYNVVVSGTLVLVTDHGEVTLEVGDTTVVMGGRHAWSNRTTEPAVLAAVSIAVP